jgi:hypothetical protein
VARNQNLLACVLPGVSSPAMPRMVLSGVKSSVVSVGQEVSINIDSHPNTGPPVSWVAATSYAFVLTGRHS